MTNEIDLFDNWKELPQPVIELMEEMEGCDVELFSFKELDQLNERFKKLGYSFEYDFDRQPFNLKKL